MNSRYCLLLLVSGLVWAQDRPVIDPRGVRNAFTQEPAPARVGLGGLMQIEGPRLGPLEPVTATAVPWPQELGGVKVFVNNRPAAIYSAKPGMVIAQAPPDAPLGLAEIVVEQNGHAQPPGAGVPG